MQNMLKDEDYCEFSMMCLEAEACGGKSQRGCLCGRAGGCGDF